MISSHSTVQVQSIMTMEQINDTHATAAGLTEPVELPPKHDVL